ncbi:MAG: M23 family metallopeptidase [Thermodesulfobacteriota bacterium]
MDKRYITLFVLSNHASRTRQLRIPVRLLKAGVALGVVFTLVLMAGIFDYARIRSNYSEYYRLKKESTAQKIELQSFASKIKDMEAQMAKLNLFDKKLRILANIEAPAETANADQIMGIGGASTEDDYFDSGSRLDGLVNRMRSDIRVLKHQAATQENSFTDLQERLVKQTSFLAATPSIWPVRGWVTSTYGKRISPFTGRPQKHKGLDIANRVGTPVIAPANGIVVKAGRNGGLGKSLVISHGYGVKTRYGHLSKIFVKVGQRIKRGDKIAAMGNTGRSTGPHLHYEVSLNGLPVNPSKYILN